MLSWDGARDRSSPVGGPVHVLMKFRRKLRAIRRGAMVGAAMAVIAPAAVAAQRPAASAGPAPSGASVRAATRQYRESHEAEIAREFAELLAIPNVASDTANIGRNATAVMAM